jgi:rsbT co-antagonist protein RsbR
MDTDVITTVIADNEQEILPEWLELLKKGGALQTGRISEAELAAQCREFLRLFRDALAKGAVDVANQAYTPVRDFLGDVSRSRALQGF